MTPLVCMFLSGTDSGGFTMQRHKGVVLNQSGLIANGSTPGDQTSKQKCKSKKTKLRNQLTNKIMCWETHKENIAGTLTGN